MFVPDAFAPDDKDISPSGRLELIEANVRARGSATQEEFDWVVAQGCASGAFPTFFELKARKDAERERDLIDECP